MHRSSQQTRSVRLYLFRCRCFSFPNVFQHAKTSSRRGDTQRTLDEINETNASMKAIPLSLRSSIVVGIRYVILFCRSHISFAPAATPTFIARSKVSHFYSIVPFLLPLFLLTLPSLFFKTPDYRSMIPKLRFSRDPPTQERARADPLRVPQCTTKISGSGAWSSLNA